VKSIAFAFNPATAKKLHKSIQSILNKRANGPMVRQQNAKIWLVTSDDSVDARHEMAADYREHQGAACYISTIGATQVGIDLAGATVEHWIDVAHTVDQMHQSEDRPNAVNRTTGLHIIYYQIADSVDCHLLDLLLPKLETVSTVAGSDVASDMSRALQPGDEETATEIMSRLLEGIEA